MAGSGRVEYVIARAALFAAVLGLVAARLTSSPGIAMLAVGVQGCLWAIYAIVRVRRTLRQEGAFRRAAGSRL